MTLAMFYPFTTTDLYTGAFRYLPRHHTMQLLMILLTILMVSNVRYAALPRAGVRSVRGLLGLATILLVLVFGILRHDAFFFPLAVAYMAYGVVRAVFLGFFAEDLGDDAADIAEPSVITSGEGSAPAYGERLRGAG